MPARVNVPWSSAMAACRRLRASQESVSSNIGPSREKSVREDQDIAGSGGATALPRGIPIVLLAAGEGRRLGQCKPLARVGGRSLLEQAIVRLRPLTSRLVVVLGYQHQRIRWRTRLQPHQWAINPHWSQGQSTSLQRGLYALPGNSVGALICLVDQPDIPALHYRDLLLTATREPGRTVATAAGGRLMAPAYLPRSLWPELYRLRGDQGARQILERDGRALRCDRAQHDIDTPHDLARYQDQH